jgi:multidrug resistance efflux pump
MKKSIVLLALLAVTAVAAGYYWPFGRSKALVFPGIVEIQEVRLGSKVGGRVARLYVREGDKVQPGMKLVEFEVPELENQRDQLLARLEAAKAEYEKAKAGPRPEEKDAALAAAESANARLKRIEKGWRVEEIRLVEAELRSAEAEMERAGKELERTVQLVRDKSASKSDYDAALAARDRSVAQVAAAKAKADMYNAGSRREDIAEAKAEFDRTLAKYKELEAGTRKEDIQLAYAKFQEAKAKVEEIEINIREKIVRVPDTPEFKDAVVEVLAIRPGDIVPANQSVVRLLCTDDLWVKIYVPETKYGFIKLNETVEVKIDTFPNRRYEGRVIQKASISEFTPRNVQSVDERRHQVFGVKIAVADRNEVFNAGMAAEVTVPTE